MKRMVSLEKSKILFIKFHRQVLSKDRVITELQVLLVNEEF